MNESTEKSVVNDSKHVTDHLANERTYLAWIRTGVSMMGLGIVIAKLKYIIGVAGPTSETSGVVHAADIGLWFAAVGVITIVMSVFFFLETQQEIRQATYRSKRRFVLSLAVLTGLLGLIVIWYLMQPVHRL